MPDGTTQNGTAMVAADEITNDNGAAVSARQAQRIKVDSRGLDGAFTDASPTNPFPVQAHVEKDALFRGRAATFRTIGRGGTVPRRVLALWNAAGSGRTITINQITLDIMQTAVVPETVIAIPIRVYRITSSPTDGSPLTKSAKDTALTSSASISLLQDASADGTNSVAALAATTAAGSALTQVFASRLITAAGFEAMDRAVLLADKRVLIRPGEGVVLSLDITLAAQEPASVHTLAEIDWFEAA